MAQFIWPCDINTVSQEFGGFPNSFQPDGHTGMDFAVPIGTPVLAAAEGVVLHGDWASKLGWPNKFYLAQDWDGPANGDQSAGICVIVDYGTWVGIYAHLSSTHLNPGDRVKQGQSLGLSGMTGRSTGPHVHMDALPDGWNVLGKYYGRVNPRKYCSTGGPAPVTPQDAPVGSNQRVTGSVGIIRRTEPKVSTDNIIDNFAGDLILTLAGYVHGQKLTINGYTSDIWVKGGVSGGYMWIGGFTNQSLDGLPDLTPAAAPTNPNVRTTGPDGVNRRTIADKAGTLIDQFGADLDITIGGYLRATDPYGDGNTVWFVGGLTGGYMHSSGFTSQSTDGLKDLTPDASLPATPAPPVPVYDFVADFDYVEKIPANLTNVQRASDNPGVVVFPAQPEKDVIHQMGTPGVDTIGSTINEFKRKDSFKSAHFVIEGKRIVQMVSLNDRAYHAGPEGNKFVGYETGPYQDADTIASVRRVIADVDKKTGQKAVLIRHRDVPGNNTLCGSLIDLARYETAPVVTPPVVTQPVVVPVPTPAPVPTESEAAVLKKFSDWVIGQFLSRK